MLRRLSNIYCLGVKELRSLRRDTALVLILVYAFTYAIYTRATGAGSELHNASIAIVDEDHSTLSARIGNAFFGPWFQAPREIAFTETDAGMDSGQFTFVLDIPPDFERDVLRGRQPPVQINIDATAMSQAGNGARDIGQIIGGELVQFLRSHRDATVPPAKLIIRMKFNPNLTDAWFVSVMEIINVVTMLSMMLAGGALIREREHGTIDHLLVMPLRPAEIMLAKVWANGLVILVSVTLSLWFVVQIALAVPLAGSIALFLTGTALYLFASTALGILLATLAQSMPQFGLLFILVALPMEILSGGIMPLQSMPVSLQWFMQFVPSTHYVSFAQAILYRGADFNIVWRDFTYIILSGAIFFAIAAFRFRKTFEQAVV